jgi:hypothetical protein
MNSDKSSELSNHNLYTASATHGRGKKCVKGFLVEKPEGKRPLGTPKA